MATMARTSATAAGDPVTGSPAYPLGSSVDPDGHVIVGGCDLVAVAREFGTPAYVYAPEDIRARARAYLEALRARGVESEVLFASKAAPLTAIYRICREEGLSVDVASGGELHMALAAGFEPERIYMHGNNKSAAELRMAFAAGIGCIVVDSLDEIERADWLADRDQDVLIRLTPGVAASTHEFVRTGEIDSKFGFAIDGGQADEAVAAVRRSRNLRLAGFHAHLGSQIYELDPYVRAIEVMAEFCRPHEPRVMNVGGGLGIAYAAADRPPSIAEYVNLKVDALARCFDPLPRVLLEPGRSLVGNAGVTLYTIGAVKEIPGVRTYVAVDGGMSDNLRPMLYGSEYEALIADRADRPARVTTTVAGKHCEAGDTLVRDVDLADPRPGDILVTPATGAYGYAMASNYNGIPRPPVVFCDRGSATVVVRRETYADLTARDVDDD
jgi:diaminopimelate decarboxylase